MPSSEKTPAAAPVNDAHLNLKDGTHKGLQEGLLYGSAGLVLLYGSIVAIYPELLTATPIWGRVCVVLALIACALLQYRLYPRMLAYQRGQPIDVTVHGLDPGRYYKTLGQEKVAPGQIEARIRKRHVKSSMVVRYRFEEINDSRKEKLPENAMPPWFVVTPDGRYELRPIEEAEFKFDATGAHVVEPVAESDAIVREFVRKEAHIAKAD